MNVPLFIQHSMELPQKPIRNMTQRLNAFVETHPGAASFLVRLRLFILSVPVRSMEVLLASVGMGTGFWVGWPVKNYDISHALYYETLVRYMSPVFWTCLFVFASSPSLFLFGSEKWKRLARLFGCGILQAIWLLLAMLFISERAPRLATIWTPIFAFYEAWVVLVIWLTLHATPTYRRNG